MTSKPRWVVVWCAFLAGIPGLVRYQICRDLKQKIEELTITQKVCWKDLPLDRIKQIESSSSDTDEVGISQLLIYFYLDRLFQFMIVPQRFMIVPKTRVRT